MFYHESRKLVYFGVKRSKVKVARQKCCLHGYVTFVLIQYSVVVGLC